MKSSATLQSHSIGTLLVFLGILLASYSAKAQTFTIRGTVNGADQRPIEGATVSLAGTQKSTLTNATGTFTLKGVAPGRHTITVRSMGHATQQQPVTVTANDVNVTFALLEEASALNELVVEGRSEGQLVRERPIKTDVITMKNVAAQPTTIIELMNRTAGVRVRQTGGLGSNASLTLNGFQNRAIKYFKDGIPMDYLGAGYDFTLVPVNMLDRLEIYKGVMPTSLGADALGGGLNMVTKSAFRKFAEVSYEHASFNTHRASANVFVHDTATHLFIGADLFYNYSDNNYHVMAPFTDQNLGTETEQRVKLFHNKFTHAYGEVYGGVKNTTWADELRIGITGFQIDRQHQYGARMRQAFGAYTSEQSAIIPTIRYKKSFLKDRITLDQFLVRNDIHSQQADTARGVYDWYGNFQPVSTRHGESTVFGSLSDITYSYFTSRTNVAAVLNDRHELELNVVYSKLSRKGKRSLRPRCKKHRPGCPEHPRRLQQTGGRTWLSI